MCRLLMFLFLVALPLKLMAADSGRMDIYFGFGGDVVTKNDDARLAHLAAKFKHSRFVLSGFTDAWAKESFNWSLAVKRIERVRSILQRHGVDKRQIIEVVNGETWERIVAPNEGKRSFEQSRNRRVEVCVIN